MNNKGVKIGSCGIPDDKEKDKETSPFETTHSDVILKYEQEKFTVLDTSKAFEMSRSRSSLL